MSLVSVLVSLPLALQGAAMTVDELHFHRERGLGIWERIGHPLDTLTFIACLGWVHLAPPSRANLTIYVVLAIASCLVITKDEAVHARRCSAGEHWLHAVLFVLHPICLAGIAFAWPSLHASRGDIAEDARLALILHVQLVLTGAFGAYQTLYWNVPWRRRRPDVK